MVLTALACVATRRLLGPILPMLIRDVPPEVARDLVEHNFMSSTTSLWNVLYRRDVTLDLDALPEDLPVVFIHGTDDATAPIDSIRGLVDGRLSSQLVELIGVDHHPWLRCPAECAERVSRASWDVQREGAGFPESGSVDRGVLGRRQCTDLSAGPAQLDRGDRNRRRKESF
jgi:pimeloyl-ACP methyl ester carboxylesterase